MIDFIKIWYQRYFTHPEAVVLLIFLVAVSVILLTMGAMLAPVLAAVVIAYTLEWVIGVLEHWHVPRVVAIFFVFILFLGLLLLFTILLLPTLWGQVDRLFREEVLTSVLSRWRDSLMLLPDRFPDLISQQQIDEVLAAARSGVTRIGQYILSVSLSSITIVISMIVYLVMVPLMVFFLLLDKDKLLIWFAHRLPDDKGLLVRVWQEVHNQLGNYVRGKAAEILIVGIVTYILFAALKLPYAPLLASLVGVSVLIPYVGAAVVTIPVALVAYFEWGLSSEFVYLMIGYFILQLLDGYVLVPILFSEVVNLHPVAIIVAILLFGGLWGFWGIFFAIPLAILVKAVFDAWPRLETE